MKCLRFPIKVVVCLMICLGFASADSLQLRNGRRLQGKYIGGTSTAVGFMSGASVEYFSTADVSVLIFENAADSSLGGTQQPSPMAKHSSAKGTAEHRLNASSHVAKRGSRRAPASNNADRSGADLKQVSASL